MDTENSKALIRKVSLVEQIARQLRKEILTQVYPPDSEFPSEKALSERFGTSHMTVRGALKMLAQEGFIEIAHGKRNIVKDFRVNVGIDVFPELLVTHSKEMITREGFSTFQNHIFWLYDQILLSAAEKATPQDRPALREKVRAFTQARGLEAIWKAQLDLLRGILRISNNYVLMMYVNSYTKTYEKLLNLGMINATVYPVPDYETVLFQVVDAICANDKKAVRKLSKPLQDVAKQDIDLWYSDN